LMELALHREQHNTMHLDLKLEVMTHWEMADQLQCNFIPKSFNYCLQLLKFVVAQP
jgi:hypothetical protein